MKRSKTKSILMTLVTTVMAVGSVIAPFAAHAQNEDALAQMSIAQIGEINRRAQLLSQSRILGKRIEAFQTQSEVTMNGMKVLRDELKAAQEACEQTCTSQQTQSIVQSIKKFSAIAAGAAAASKGMGVVAGGVLRLSKTNLAPKGKVIMNSNLQSFYRPWKTVAGRTMLIAGTAFAASSIVDNVIFTNNRATQDNITHIQKDLNQREITLQKMQDNISELNAQLRPITLALQQSQILQTYSVQK